MKKYLSLSIICAFLFTFNENAYFYQAKNVLENVSQLNSTYSLTLKDKREYTCEDQDANLNLGLKLIGNKSFYKEKISFLGYDNMITAAQMDLYQKMRSGINKITDRKNSDGFYDIQPIVLRGCRLKSEEIKKVIYAFQNDNPEIFWLANRYYVTYRGMDTIIKISAVMKKGEYEESLKKLNDQVDKILKSVPEGLSEYERELFVHDYIIENCKYDKSKDLQRPWERYTCLGCLVRKEAVCEGYSKATQLLLMRLGVECRTITGSRGQEQHMWNMVKIDNDWYHLDVTWDCTEELNRYSYFNVTDDVIMHDHKINEEVSKMTSVQLYDKNYNFSLPVCSSKKYNYFTLNSLYVTYNTTSEDLATYINKRAKNNKNVFYFTIDPKMDFSSIIKVFFQAPQYKFFNCIRQVNNHLNSKVQFNTRSVRYSENKVQKVIGVKAEYI